MIVTMTDDTHQFLTAAETASLRRKTPQALTMERSRGAGPPYVVDGGRVLYPADELREWLEARRVDPARKPV